MKFKFDQNQFGLKAWKSCAFIEKIQAFYGIQNFKSTNTTNIFLTCFL